MSKNLVIVESPAKAHTIEKYLGSDFQVLASVGHIRKDTKVDKNTFDVTYEVDPGHKQILADLKKAMKACDKVWLATDEDREGEAISWHLTQVLKLPEDTARITFHEITKSALEEAIKNPRTVDMAMVSSQQARQTLDMLVGFDLSGIVRKKVPGAISAGRVQSPALRLIVEREQQIEKFASKFTYKVVGDFGFPTTLNKSFDTEEEVKAFLEKLIDAEYLVSAVEHTPGTRKPAPPFTTASMQIEANSRLGYSTRVTMNAAQALYQAGLITYHRTDSLNLSKQAVASMASYIEDTYGKKYLKIRNFKTKDSSAQEAHEAIRPTNIAVEKAGKNTYEQHLYALIRARALSTQMADAELAKTTITISTPTEYVFEGKGEVITFDGFLKVYGRLKESELPDLQVGDTVEAKYIAARQNYSKPPARYTEGSLVKELEKLGIGRPSTYASIMTAIQSRGYVVKGESEGEDRDVVEFRLEDQKISRNIVQEKFGANKGKLLPTPIGELISGFLTDHFKNIVDYKFTASIEKDLDLIAERKLDRVKMLRDFYGPFNDEVLAAEGIERYNNARLLGHDPKTGKAIYAKVGKNGGFIQLGDNEKETGEKPVFAPLPKRKTVKTVTLEQALNQLELPQLPRSLGKAADGTEIIAAAGPFGPYLKAGKYNVPMKSKEENFDPYTITLEQAEPLYIAKRDSYIADWGDIQIINGAYGPYVKGPGRRNNAKIPKDVDPKTITKEQAEEMLASKPKTTRRPATRRASAKKKTSTKKTTTKKSAKKTTKKAAAK
ncbi:type I DNA topoisomerase [Candidatus Saccharibacteria bacterium]|nr:type I DNA topoisomerase [Candidatus Saccharibacteria bacterium]